MRMKAAAHAPAPVHLAEVVAHPSGIIGADEDVGTPRVVVTVAEANGIQRESGAVPPVAGVVTAHGFAGAIRHQYLTAVASHRRAEAVVVGPVTLDQVRIASRRRPSGQRLGEARP